MPSSEFDLPLAGVRVIELIDGPLLTIGRVLADLGADVIRLEPPTGSPSRHSGLVSEGLSMTDEVRNINKKSVVADLTTEEGRATALKYIGSADIVVHDKLEAQLAGTGLDRASLRSAFPKLVVFAATDFGQTGPRSGWRGTADVHFALSTELSRSGLPEITEPLLPPHFLAYETAAMQALWALLMSYYNALRTGKGEYVDYSVQEGLIQLLDPPMGVAGTARSGASLNDIVRGRPDARHLYPIFPAKDGYVRICVLSPKQWMGIYEWMGKPEEFSDEKYMKSYERYAAKDTLTPLYTKLFAGLTRQEALKQGQQYGVPIAELLDIQEVMSVDQYQEAGTFTEATLADGRTVTVPAALFDIDGTLVGVREPAPAIGSGAPVEHTAPSFDLPAIGASGHPFEGLRVLDLGVIIVGAELGHLFGDHGAEVIKIESHDFPDGSRQVLANVAISEGVVWSHRNKKSAGVNLRNEEGREVFRELVRKSDIVLTNFKGGTMESLGFGYEELKKINPRILFSESSAFGNRGPWSRRAGYGPLARASAGLTKIWAYPGIDNSFSDAITVYPDHSASRANAIVLLALLLRRARTGVGGWISTAQVDTVFSGLADYFALESITEGTVVKAEGNIRGGDAPRGLFAAAGDDEWIVIDVVDDAAFKGLAKVIGKPEWLTDSTLSTAEGRLARGAELREAVAAWAVQISPVEAARLLQAEGVPAGEMLRVGEMLSDPHLVGRKAFGEQGHPMLGDEILPTNLSEARFENIPEVRLDIPAPMPLENTREVIASVLGYDDAKIDALVQSGGLEVAEKVTA